MTTDALIIKGDCLNVMAGLPDGSIDAIVTDPPYGLSAGPVGYIGEKTGGGFMGKDWDSGVPGESFWREALRVAKPGCHILAAGGSRTYHRLAVAIEDAGWEIRDCIIWMYGSGFPKSHNLKDDWKGWGTALKPAFEPFIMARKPLDGTVANNVQRHGCGGLNVDGCRVGTGENTTIRHSSSSSSYLTGKIGCVQPKQSPYFTGSDKGRWPANVIHDGSDEVVGVFPEVETGGGGKSGGNPGMWSGKKQIYRKGHADSGSASRFFYCAKASPSERDEGCEGLERKNPAVESAHSTVCVKCNRQRVNVSGSCQCDEPEWVRVQQTPRGNHHPTVKPVDLMKYLCRLITPPGGLILDPFCGSGSTGVAAMREGFNFIGIELNADYAEIARRRIDHERNKTPLFSNVI